MNMFRPKNNQTPMILDHFGVGSLIIEPKAVQYMVVATATNTIALLNLNTMMVYDQEVVVEDINYLKEEEVRKLVGNNLVDAFSDYEYDPRGLKQM
jgi:hypothetical protein